MCMAGADGPGKRTAKARYKRQKARYTEREEAEWVAIT